MICRLITLIYMFLLLAPINVLSADMNQNTLDALLSSVRNSSMDNAKLNKQRELRFLEEKESRATLLNEAKKNLKIEQNKSTELQHQFDVNEKKITELEERLRLRSGSLGELMGVVKQVSGDAVGVFKSSIISSQILDREFDIAELSSRKVLPSISQLEQLWFAIQQEMTESGKIVTFKSNVASPDGTNQEKDVTRIGSFNVISDGKYLRFSDANARLVELDRQPGSEYTNMALDFLEQVKQMQ